MTGGGSGGHITPLLSLAHELKAQRNGCRLIYIGLKGDRLDGLKASYAVFDEVYYVSSGKFRRYHDVNFLVQLFDLKTLLLNTRDIFKVIAGFFSSCRLLRQIKPDAVFSKGGFVAVPVGLAAHWLKLPIITHDSDTVPGLANRIIGRWAKIHATGMPANFYDYPQESIRYTGIPIDKHFGPVGNAQQARYKEELGIPSTSPVLLVGGAGLGARDVNNKIIEAAPQLMAQFSTLVILHITGKQLADQVRAGYSALISPLTRERVKIIGFTSEFYKYSGAADLVITRAGATTIAELAVQKKAVILIPAPFLTGGHQLKNAQMLEQKGAVLTLSNDVEPEKILTMVADLLRAPAKREELATKLGLMAKLDAATGLAKAILEVIEQGNSA